MAAGPCAQTAAVDWLINVLCNSPTPQPPAFFPSASGPYRRTLRNPNSLSSIPSISPLRVNHLDTPYTSPPVALSGSFGIDRTNILFPTLIPSSLSSLILSHCLCYHRNARRLPFTSGATGDQSFETRRRTIGIEDLAATKRDTDYQA